MGPHIAQIGTGRVGRPTAYNIMCAGLASRLTVCDTKPGLAKAFAEELYHAAASLNIDLEIIACEKDEDVKGADVVLVSAGEPRLPGVKMSRRDLVTCNARIIKNIAEITTPQNAKAKYIVITNPVDAMAMVFKKYSVADFVIGTGTNLETLRFKSRLARILNVQVSKVSGWVGGEHGDSAVVLWSTVRVNDIPIEKYLRSKRIEFSKSEVESYVKEISRIIIDNIGGTEFGPASSFRDIVRAIIKDTKEVFPIATPIKLTKIPEPVYVSVPLYLGSSIGPTLFNILSEEEKGAIENAAEEIFSTYKTAIERI